MIVDHIPASPYCSRRSLRWILPLLLVLFAHAVSAQSLLQKKVTVEARKKPLAEVLKTMGRQGGFYFSYNSNLISRDSLVTLSARDVTVKQALDMLLGEHCRYVETDKYIILQPSEKEKWYTISGYITDAQSGDPLADVSVFERQQLVSSITGKDGYFRLLLKDRDRYRTADIVVSKGFYQDTSISLIKGYDQEVSLSIVPETYALPDMVVTQYGSVGRSWLSRRLLSSRLKTQNINLGKFFVDKPYQFSLIPGVGTHGKMSGQVENKFSFNLLGGYTAGVNGVEIAGCFNIDKKNVQYVQLAGMFNIVAGNTRGAQVSGFSNYVGGKVEGVQATGFANKAGKVDGVQASGFANMALDTVRGVQAAGFMNGAKAANVQVAGFLNISGQVRGAQVAGFMNAAGDVDGIQIAGFINMAKKVKGIQISGFINLADSSDYPIGLINIIRSGDKAIGISSDEYGSTFVTLRSGGKVLYGIFGLGANTNGATFMLYGMEAGLGAHLPIIKKHLCINNEITAMSLSNINGLFFHDYSARILPAVRFGAFEVFAGAGFNVSFYSWKPPFAIMETKTLHSGVAAGQQMEMRIGYKGGVQIHF
jgi:hypothetical protein